MPLRESPLEGDSYGVTRRTLIGGAVALAAAGCSTRARGASGQSVKSRIRLPVLIGSSATGMSAADALAPVLAAFNSTQAEAEAVLATVGAQTAPESVAVAPLPWGAPEPLLDVGGTSTPPVELSALLRAVNFDAGALAPDFVRAGQWGGRQFGLPYAYSPMSVWVAPSDWATLRVPVPTPMWTAAQFVATCVELHAAPGRTKSVIGGFPWFPYPEVWPGWVWGYGGQAVDPQGRIVLTDDGAREGIAALVGAMRAAVPDMCTSDTSLMGFTGAGRTAYVPPGGAGVRALARFPVMPVTPAVPAQVWLMAVNSRYRYPQLAAGFLAWLLSRRGQALMVAAGYASMLGASPQQPSAGTGHTEGATAESNDAWTKTFPPGFDLGGLDPPMVDLRAVPTELAVTTAIVSGAVWKCLDANSDKERTASLAAAEQAANACLALPAAQQAAFLRPYQQATTSTSNAPCFGPALRDHSRYAVAAVPPSRANGASGGASR